jgi:hypothetical protein
MTQKRSVEFDGFVTLGANELGWTRHSAILSFSLLNDNIFNHDFHLLEGTNYVYFKDTNISWLQVSSHDGFIWNIRARMSDVND